MKNINFTRQRALKKEEEYLDPNYSISDLNSLFDYEKFSTYDMKEIISRLIDGSSFSEYKKDYGKTILCGTAKIKQSKLFS